MGIEHIHHLYSASIHHESPLRPGQSLIVPHEEPGVFRKDAGRYPLCDRNDGPVVAVLPAVLESHPRGLKPDNPQLLAAGCGRTPRLQTGKVGLLRVLLVGPIAGRQILPELFEE